MLASLRVLLFVLGASAVLICLSIMLLGPTSTAADFERAFDALTGWSGPLTQRWPATMDSELRFYAPLFGAFGLLSLRVAVKPLAQLELAPWLAAVFFAGGLGRAISYVVVGAPHPLFVALMVVELGLPPVLFGLWFGTRKSVADVNRPSSRSQP